MKKFIVTENMSVFMDGFRTIKSHQFEFDNKQEALNKFDSIANGYDPIMEDERYVEGEYYTVLDCDEILQFGKPNIVRSIRSWILKPSE